MPLLEEEAPRDPLILFDRWLREAAGAGERASNDRGVPARRAQPCWSGPASVKIASPIGVITASAVAGALSPAWSPDTCAIRVQAASRSAPSSVSARTSTRRPSPNSIVA